MAELVTDYLEGVLPLRSRLGARLHLFQCEACRHYVDQMRHTIALLSSRPPPAPEPALEDRVVAAATRPDDPPDA
jgi:anti-sigma factor RsiW